ncbi:hypothetical protein [Microbacterium sp.]|uniref:hypothetical protein n=1 Tax=Microbacterium sp. TaxID=51671 RepID=UPI0039E2EF25
MYILLALIAACALGIAAHFLIDGRELRGVAVTPVIATAAAAIIYTALQWAGIGQDNLWLWVASILGSVALAAIATIALVAVRRRTDAEAKAALGI